MYLMAESISSEKEEAVIKELVSSKLLVCT